MIDYAKLKARKFQDVEHAYDEKDTMLYALGLGYGHDPMDEKQLQFVYEKNLKALPTLPVVIASPGFWVKEPDSGIDWVRIVHGEQSLTVHKPLPVAGTVIGRLRITALVDKGEGKGALVYQERTLHEKSSNALLSTIHSLTFCRADGGFSAKPGNGPKGGDPAPAPKPATPDTAPQAVCDLPTLPQAALIYRLSGDYNPLHADPAYAAKAGFKMPILHGRATFSVVGHALVKTVCGYDPAKLKSMAGRFSSPVYPGETIRTEMWVDAKVVSFRATVPARGVTVLNNGRAEIA